MSVESLQRILTHCSGNRSQVPSSWHVRLFDPVLISYHLLHCTFKVVPYVYSCSFADTHVPVLDALSYTPLFKIGTVQFTMLQTGGGNQTLVVRHVAELSCDINPALQVKKTTSPDLYIIFDMPDKLPLCTVGGLHISETKFYVGIITIVLLTPQYSFDILLFFTIIYICII